MLSFANEIPLIEKAEDLKYVDKFFNSYFHLDRSTPKFACTTAEIFARKSFSGCSDIGLAIAPILRIKGIPTVYVKSANIMWIRDVKENNASKDFMQGHIFLEVYIGGK